MIERTLSIVKPDAVRRNKVGEILARLEAAGLKIVAGKFIHLTREQAERFYAEHSARDFFGSLMDFMTSGPVFVSALEGEDAIAKNRAVMGSTDPAKADAGTIRKDFGSNIEQNAAHGSDKPESARREVSFYFNELEILR